MIVEFLCGLVISLIQLFFSAISIATYIPAGISDTITMVIKGMQFFPIDVWLICLGSFLFWTYVHLGAAVFKFVFRKIPILNIRW